MRKHTSTQALIEFVTVSCTAASVASPLSVNRWMKICQSKSCLTQLAEGVISTCPSSVGTCSASIDAHSPSVHANRRLSIRNLSSAALPIVREAHIGRGCPIQLLTPCRKWLKSIPPCFNNARDKRPIAQYTASRLSMVGRSVGGIAVPSAQHSQQAHLPLRQAS